MLIMQYTHYICCCWCLWSADVTEHGCLTTVSASGASEAAADPEAGHMVTSISELDEEAAARVVAELAANGKA
jgi:hypothetical protein